MALNQTNKLVWIVNTIRNAGRITLKEISRKWKDNIDMSGGIELDKRTFHKWREKIRETFDLDIECDLSTHTYYISNISDLENGSAGKWLFDTFSVSNALVNCKSIKDRILLEKVPSGVEYLQPIVDAMKVNQMLHITYRRYSVDEEHEHYIMPLCVKLYRQRWYMVGRHWNDAGTGHTTVFCLDRIKGIRPSSHTFDYPSDFSPEEFFSFCLGVITDDNTQPKTIKLKVNAHQANYLRDLPLHESQKEIERNDDYSIFTLFVRPTIDLIQEILWNMDKVEVLEPVEVRKKVKNVVEKMSGKYEK
ncbi:MAG: WYL domain-containing protein [Bacteroidales bacterium]|nr:WYL domain-containing protein [Bacteroidales bacterium]